MNILQKMMTLFKASAREITDSVLDADSTRMFQQELQDAREQLREARGSLDLVIRQKKQAKNELAEFAARLEEQEDNARKALANNQHALALEVANKILTLETEISHLKTVFKGYKKQVANLKKIVTDAEAQLNNYDRQLAMVKTTEQVQKATATITRNFSSSDSSLVTARATLANIKNRQQENEANLEANQQIEAELSNQTIEQKLEAAGITGHQQLDSVLQRLRSND